MSLNIGSGVEVQRCSRATTSIVVPATRVVPVGREPGPLGDSGSRAGYLQGRARAVAGHSASKTVTSDGDDPIAPGRLSTRPARRRDRHQVRRAVAPSVWGPNQRGFPLATVVGGERPGRGRHNAPTDDRRRPPPRPEYSAGVSPDRGRDQTRQPVARIERFKIPVQAESVDAAVVNGCRRRAPAPGRPLRLPEPRGLRTVCPHGLPVLTS